MNYELLEEEEDENIEQIVEETGHLRRNIATINDEIGKQNK